MTAPLLGCIADDYTGATDLSSMLVRAGLRVIQCFGTPRRTEFYADADAVVVSLKSRSIPASEAVDMSLDALRFLQSLHIKRFFFKYCSTFDSTPDGNIGPVADALAAELQCGDVLFCPTFPENGRTVYCGHLFVGDVPLHESSMRNHPLNPMTDSNLVRVLQTQSRRRVESLPLDGNLELGNDRHLIADAMTDHDLARVANLARDHRLLTGGSAIARFWAEALMLVATRSQQKPPERNDSWSHGRSMVLAGSCSDATRTQVDEFAKHYPVLGLDMTKESVEATAKEALDWCNHHWNQNVEPETPLLISSGSSADIVSAARQRWGEQVAADRVERIFALIAKGLVARGVRRIIVAGGETSGAVINSLAIKAVRIGREIAPGVPWVQAIDASNDVPSLGLVLKSGNFGGPRFFLDALECQP